MKHDDDSDTNCNRRNGNHPQIIGKGVKYLKIREVATIKTTALLQLTVVWKILKEVKNNPAR